MIKFVKMESKIKKPSFKIDEQKEFSGERFGFLYDVEIENFWFKNRRELIYKFIKSFVPDYGSKRMLEVGCGTGNVLRYLNERGINCEGADLFFEGLCFARKRISKPLYQIDVRQMPFRSVFDIIGLFDVLEHIKEEKLVIQNIFKALKPSGFFILTVPALDILWSETDTISFHKRRYTLPNLEELLMENGFSIVKSNYFVFFLLPVIFFLRKKSNYKGKTTTEKLNIAKRGLKLTPILNSILYFILRFEQWFILHFLDLPVGSSCIVLAQKSQSERSNNRENKKH